MNAPGSAIEVAAKGELTLFRPEATLAVDTKADAVIEYAQRMKDWPLLERAVDEKIEQQREFVRWWESAVRGKGKKANNSDPRYFAYFAQRDRWFRAIVTDGRLLHGM